jgi:Domain of unknown function (DUF1824)
MSWLPQRHDYHRDILPLRHLVAIIAVVAVAVSFVTSDNGTETGIHVEGFLVRMPMVVPSRSWWYHHVDDGNVITKMASIGPEKEDTTTTARQRVIDASNRLAEWDRWFSASFTTTATTRATTAQVTNNNHHPMNNITRLVLREAVLCLNQVAAHERAQRDTTTGRCMLGICAATAPQGMAALKSWVSTLQLPRGLLHGMDVDGVPISFNDDDGTGVYIKYNSGGVYTFADIRKSQMGFNAIWKPGDAMLEVYDGDYRGVYFQVELADGEFRQYLLPLNLFDSDDNDDVVTNDAVVSAVMETVDET